MKKIIYLKTPLGGARYTGTVGRSKGRNGYASRRSTRLSSTQCELHSKADRTAPIIDFSDADALERATQLASERATMKGYKVYVDPWGYLTNSEMLTIAMQVGAPIERG